LERVFHRALLFGCGCTANPNLIMNIFVCQYYVGCLNIALVMSFMFIKDITKKCLKLILYKGHEFLDLYDKSYKFVYHFAFLI
jgi:hypothetical protein